MHPADLAGVDRNRRRWYVGYRSPVARHAFSGSGALHSLSESRPLTLAVLADDLNVARRSK